MEKFIVSARKYRPQNFSTVVGQEHITTTLKNAINNNQLAHAFLFCGPRGVGKTTCARILAKTINCENKTADGEACNTCNSCISFDHGISLNIHELDAASNNSVDDIRSLVDQVRFAPQAGEYKVYIVDEVHMLSASAFNAFLKTLEEPPPYAIFILATTEKHKILPTILSRCQIFDFKRITANDTVTHLREICDKETITAENTALHIIAQKSEGCLRDALSILDKIVSFTGGKLTYANTLEHLNILDEDYFFKLLQFATEQKLSDALLLFDDINQKGFEGDTFLDGFIEFIRNLLVSKDVKAAILLEVAEDFRDKYLQAAKEISANWMIAALNITHEAALNYKQSRNKRLCVEMALIKLCYINQAVELSEGNNETIQKKKLVESAKPVSFKGISFIKLKELPVSKIIEKKKIVAEATLFVKKEIMPTASAIIVSKIPEPGLKKTGFGSLEKIRARLLQETKHEKTLLELNMENLQKAWIDYTENLFTEKKFPLVTQFKMAELRVDDEFNFTVITEGVLQQRFIEMERSSLIPYMQKYFGNKLLKYSIEINEPENTADNDKKSLSSKQQYEFMIKKYPLIKELKDKLKMEIDY